MKRLLLTLISISTFLFIQAQQILVQDGDDAYVYTNLDTAVLMAPEGATIYLPSGYLDVGSDGLLIDKELTIIGAGHYPDSTLSRTIIDGNIRMISGADRSVLEGFLLNGSILFGNSSTNDSLSNVIIKRISVASIWLGASSNLPASKNILIKDCVIRNIIDGHNAENVTISNNIINGTSGVSLCISGLKGSSILNNIIFRGLSLNYSNVFDNIITSSAFSGTFNNYRNNIFNSDPNLTTNGNYNQNNYPNLSIGDILINITSSSFNYNDDYHIISGSEADEGGVHGSDVGIYGGAEPYKEGAIPHNPRIQFYDISDQTDAQGKIQVHIKVKAQNN